MYIDNVKPLSARCPYFGNVLYVKKIEIAGLQAHNMLGHDALLVCRSAIFTVHRARKYVEPK